MALYYCFNKPYGVLSQFSDEGGHQGLAHFLNLPKDVYPVGRLDHDSEGILLLTNDNRLKTRLLDPKKGHPRTYFIQVEGQITEKDVSQLLIPMEINFKGKRHDCVAIAAKVIESPNFEERFPPIRFRKEIPTSWLSITLTQGKNRQVRRMTAHIGFPTLRLVRVGFDTVTLGDLKPGELKELSERQFISF
jgi:23S rRNA pseudouridine2457 synthase